MDWNEDGLKDLIVGEYNGQLRYYRNIGTVGNPVLTFDSYLQVGGANIDIGSYSQAWINDWNEDGNKDLLVGASIGYVYLYINEGSNANPVFNVEQTIQAGGIQLDFGSRSGPIVVDLNDDGIKDLISGDYSGKMYYCQNNGTNSRPELALKVALKTGTLDIDAGSTSRAAIVDWDSDGSMDIMVGSYDCRQKLYLQTATTDPAPIMDLINSGYMIPAGGGTINYDFSITNQTGSTLTFDVWTDMQLPSDYFIGPILQREGVTISPYGNITRSLGQSIPGRAASGYYYYYGHVGNLSSLQVYYLDYFYMYKSGSDDGLSIIGEWSCTGWQDEVIEQPQAVMPAEISISAIPNPFNPVTTVRYNLPANGQVQLKIYNTRGQEIASLVDGYRQAGQQEVIWDASNLPTGVYLVDLLAGGAHSVEKVILLK